MSNAARRAAAATRARAWRAANRDKARETSRRYEAARRRTPEGRAKRVTWEKANKERRRAQRKAKRDPARNRDLYLRRTYGISLADEVRMLLAQKNSCAICRDAFDENPRHRHIDHSHGTGKVRGVLCHRCNTLLGFARENITTLYRAASYLREGAA